MSTVVVPPIPWPLAVARPSRPIGTRGPRTMRAAQSLRAAATPAAIEGPAILALAHRIADRERPRMRRLLGRQFVAIGVGYRVRGPRRRIEPELTVRVLVRAKWRKGAKSGGRRRIPEFFAGHLAIDGRRRLTRIRTDVDEVPTGRPHSPTHGRGGVLDTEKGGRVRRGTACIIGRLAGQPGEHVVSCKHVLTHAIDEKSGVGLCPERIEIDGVPSTASPTPVASAGAVVQSKWFPASPTLSRDVAAAPVLDRSAFSSRIQGYVAADALTTDDDFRLFVSPGMRCVLATRNGVKNVTIRHVFRSVPLPGFVVQSSAGATREVELTFPRVILYDANADSAGPARGDSGAALLFDGDGDRNALLMGMHFWGDGARRGAAQFAGDVLDAPGVGTLSLVTDLNT